MAWSITGYNSLFLLYTDANYRSYLIRKSSVEFKINPQSVNTVEMVVEKDMYYWNTVYTRQSDYISLTSYNVLTYGYVYPLVTPLLYYEGTSPVSISAEDLLNKLNALLLSADVKVEKNGSFIGEQQTINFIEGTNISITATDDSINGRVDVAIASTGGSTEDPFPKILMLMGG